MQHCSAQKNVLSSTKWLKNFNQKPLLSKVRTADCSASHFGYYVALISAVSEVSLQEKKKATSKHAKINESHMWDTVIIPCL